jgi:hypothetical protein
MLHAEIWWGNLKEIYHLEYLEVDGRIIFNWILMEWNRRAWAGFIWLNKGTGDRLYINTVMNLQVPQSARNFSTS